MTPLLLTHYTATSGLGRGQAATLAALQSGRGALRPCRFDTAVLDTRIAEVDGLAEVALPTALQGYDCRNNRLAQLGLMQDEFDTVARARARHWGARRVGVFIGTSTSGVLQTEIAYRRRDPRTGELPAGFDYRGSHNAFSVTEFVRGRLGLEGPAVTVCTACSSSAKVFAAAQRMIGAGLIDAAVVGGVDSLCLTTLYGFHSLQLTSPEPCRPFDAERDGLSIGEAAAFALLERAPDSVDAGAILLLGAGESSDAHHMSSPHPEGLGAMSAMRAALAAAHTTPEAIDYINLHGTGTPSNDSAESRAVSAIFGGATPCSSTKGATGHTLGAAGALEAVISALALRAGLMPGGLNTRRLDPALPLNYLTENRRARIGRVLSNSFGFGGANCALLLARAG
ncbi:MAG TPA: beta-ketoacyl-[acyl-carrier-protein] synthase family protein [Steroidobacteraceae bacterium]|jgi:3-oxoacyl-[acyl-carrier-protein] synthase-1|nr:beta-ketoacyl-[acyl-carrier-protein] synthase family protein [Steroidobacteraceae bacterium]